MNTEERQLSEMMRRVTPEPPRRVTVEDVAFRLANQAGSGHRAPRARRGRGRGWAPVLAAASVFVVAGASAGIAVGLTSHGSKSTAGGALNTSPSSPPASVASATPAQTSTGPAAHGKPVAGGLWGAELIDHQRQGHTFIQDSLVGGANSLYAISPGYLDRVNPASGVITNAVPYTGLVSNPPVISGNTVWMVSSYAGNDVVLRGYDGSTLAQVASVTVPATGQVSTTAAGVLTSGSGGYLYVAAGDSVAVVNPSTSKVIRRINVSAGQVNSVAVAPDGGRLYVSIGAVKLLTYNLATGALTGSSTLEIGNTVGGYLVATAGGVWGTAGVGMSEFVWFAPDGDLTRAVRVTEGAGGGLDSIPVLSGGAVWIGGSHTLACASPETGQVIASATIPTDHSVVEYFSSVTMAAGHAYAYYSDQQVPQAGVVALTPPGACSG